MRAAGFKIKPIVLAGPRNAQPLHLAGDPELIHPALPLENNSWDGEVER